MISRQHTSILGLVSSLFMYIQLDTFFYTVKTQIMKFDLNKRKLGFLQCKLFLNLKILILLVFLKNKTMLKSTFKKCLENRTFYAQTFINSLTVDRT